MQRDALKDGFAAVVAAFFSREHSQVQVDLCMRCDEHTVVHYAAFMSFRPSPSLAKYTAPIAVMGMNVRMW